MTLNDLLNEEFTAWEDIFIEHKGENEIIENMTNYIDLDSYDDSRNSLNKFENDSLEMEEIDYDDDDDNDYMDYDYGDYLQVDNDVRVAIERKWKLNKIRKIMKKNLLTIS